MPKSLVDFYNRRIVAGWYRSAAMWVGIFAAVFPYMVDVLAGIVDSWSVLSGFLNLEDSTKELIRIVLLLGVLPAARSWRQRSIEQAEAKQAATRADSGTA